MRSLGCWADALVRTVPTLEGADARLDGATYRERDDAIRKCAEAARDRNFSHFVLQNGGWCGSSANASVTFALHGRSDRCVGDGKGGAYANDVYEV